MMRRTTLPTAVALLSLLSAGGTHAAGAPGSGEADANAASELQEAYPLREHDPASANAGPTAPNAGPPAPNAGPDDGASSNAGPDERARTLPAKARTLPAKTEGDGWPLGWSLVIAALVALGLAPLALKLPLIIRRLAQRPEPAVAGPADDESSSAETRVPRPRHQVSALTIRLASPAFRYCSYRDAFILRLIGERFGPVLTVRDPVR